LLLRCRVGLHSRKWIAFAEPGGEGVMSSPGTCLSRSFHQRQPCRWRGPIDDATRRRCRGKGRNTESVAPCLLSCSHSWGKGAADINHSCLPFDHCRYQTPNSKPTPTTPVLITTGAPQKITPRGGRAHIHIAGCLAPFRRPHGTERGQTTRLQLGHPHVQWDGWRGERKRNSLQVILDGGAEPTKDRHRWPVRG
jgi:hypothetical protein